MPRAAAIDSAPDAADLPLRPKVLRIVTPLLLLLGVQLWLTAGEGYWRRLEPRLLAILLVVCFLPPVFRRVVPLLDRIRRPSRRGAILTAAGITLAAGLYLPYDAVRDARPLAPRYQDEYSYMVQTQHVARGRLWMPAHPLADFFESYQLLTEPVYASVYFPGASLLFAPGVWLGLPGWVMPVVCSAAAIGLTYLIATALIDGLAGFLAALLLLTLPVFRRMSIKPMAQVPEMLLALLAIGAYLLWRRNRRPVFAAMIGVFLGWAAITRPIDALAVGVPIGVALLLDLRHTAPKAAAGILATIVLAASPFLLLQATFNRAVTGDVLHTPYNHYVARDLPGAQYGFHPYDPAARPKSSLPQKHAFFEEARPLIAAHTPSAAAREWLHARLPDLLRNSTPHPLLIMLIPAGVVAVFTRRRWVLAATAPLHLALYYPHVFFLGHYDLPVAPAVALVIVGSIPVCAAAAGRLGNAVTLFLTAAVVLLSVGQLREFNRLLLTDPYALAVGQQNRIDRLLADLPGRVIVLIRYQPGARPDQEPVYNTDVAWPDDARIIRAHDLGPARNPELFAYYAARAPDRDVYRYDRGDDTLTPLGNVRDLASAAVAPIISSPTP